MEDYKHEVTDDEIADELCQKCNKWVRWNERKNGLCEQCQKEAKMNAVKILKVGDVYQVNTQFGEKQKRNFTVREQSTGKEMEVGYFLKKDNLDLSVGDEVLMELSQQGKYINCKSIEPFTPPPEPVEPEKTNGAVPAEVWEKKDLRMVRMNSLSHAVEIFKVSKENITSEGEGYNTIVECVKDIAEQLEKWIYNGMEA